MGLMNLDTIPCSTKDYLCDPGMSFSVLVPICTMGILVLLCPHREIHQRVQGAQVHKTENMGKKSLFGLGTSMLIARAEERFFCQP